MTYYKPNGMPLTKNQAMSDSLRRQTEAMRGVKDPKLKMQIYAEYAAERQRIMKEYKK